MDKPADANSTGNTLLGGISGLIRNTVGLLMTRVELAAVELAEIRVNAGRLIVLTLVGAIFAWFAVAYWSALIVYLSWPSLGWKILLIMALVATVAVIAIFLYIKSMMNQVLFSMPATMEELRNDRDALSQ